VHVVGTVIAHIAKTAMYAPPGGRAVKTLPYFSSLAQHTSPNETMSPAQAASDPYCEGQVK